MKKQQVVNIIKLLVILGVDQVVKDLLAFKIYYQTQLRSVVGFMVEMK